MKLKLGWKTVLFTAYWAQFQSQGPPDNIYISFNCSSARNASEEQLQILIMVGFVFNESDGKWNRLGLPTSVRDLQLFFLSFHLEGTDRVDSTNRNGQPDLWAYISCAHCTSVCKSHPVIWRQINSLTLLLLLPSLPYNIIHWLITPTDTQHSLKINIW